jgi:hypothetical protein
MGFVLQIAFSAPMIASEVIGMGMGLGFANAIDPRIVATRPGARPVPVDAADPVVPRGGRASRARRPGRAQL